MKLIPQELQATPKPSIRSFDEATRVSTTDSASVIDFFEARDRLASRFDGMIKSAKQEVRRVEAGPERSERFADSVEQALYWLISAGILAYLLLAILGL